ncbi:hypothetical protein [Ferrovum sp.]|jgi:hypothetical protein|uniref:hypothetical protein n=1 Tax=Ferrovum sp. TaxID=2609467 RepID=UPI00260F3610|nr:hypothetical protein [Ferrovum sp.]
MSDNSERKQMNFYVAPETKEAITKIVKNFRTTPGLVLDVIVQNTDLKSLMTEFENIAYTDKRFLNARNGVTQRDVIKSLKGRTRRPWPRS